MRRPTSTKLLVIAVLLCGVGWAQEDGPGRGVARISLINGDVSVRRGDSGDWIAAALNAPLMVSDHVITGPSSRTEIQFDYANMLRLAANAEVRLSELEYRRYQVQVARGTVTLSVLRDSDAEMEVDTPNVSVRPVKRGECRITVRENGESEVTMRSGEAEVFTPRGSERLHSGNTMLVRGTSADPQFQIVRAAAEDDWDRWNHDRDRALERSRSYQYVSRDIYGADDLDAYGRWIYDSPYGWVWSPYGVGASWAPYRYGRWSWIDWYGWSWLSYDPWGWAPYHYGRWYYRGSYGWCWYPGYMHQHHYWRPALVAFFGWGSRGGFNVGFGIGFGHLGWIPLAPYEPYYPWYGRSYYGGYNNRTYVNNSVNVVNNVNITNVYRNARVTNAVSGVEAGEFVRGRGGQAIRTSDVDFQRASLVRGAVPITPGNESLRFSDREARVANLPRGTEPARFFSHRQPAAVERVPFEQQRQGMEQMVRRTYGDARGQSGEVAASGNLPRSTGDRSVPRAESGNLPRTEAGNLPRGGTDRSSSGWRRIGEQPSAGNSQGGADTGRRMGEPVTRPEASGAGNMPRIAEPRGQAQTPAAGSRSGSSGESWRRFGGSSQQPDSTPSPSRREPAQIERTPAPSSGGSGQGSVRRESNEGWTRFGSSRSQPSESSPRVTSPRSEAPSAPRYSEAPRSERRSAPEVGQESPRYEPRGGGEPVRINPPIVRERSTPRSENFSGMSRQSQPSGGRTSGEIHRGGGESRGGGEARGSSGSGGTVRSGGGRGRER